MVDCPSVRIPDDTLRSTTTTTRLPPTGRPGDIGAPGATVGFFVTSRINTGCNAIASVRLFSLYLGNRPTVDLERLLLSRS